MWIAAGHTDMRRGMQGLALQVQEQLKRDPHSGDLYIFRGRRGDLAKILWHDGVGLSLYANYLASYCTSFSWQRGILISVVLAESRPPGRSGFGSIDCGAWLAGPAALALSYR